MITVPASGCLRMMRLPRHAGGKLSLSKHENISGILYEPGRRQFLGDYRGSLRPDQLIEQIAVDAVVLLIGKQQQPLASPDPNQIYR